MRDQRVESLLKRGNYQFNYNPRVPFPDIDLKASEENPARLHRKLDDSLVTQYGCAMLDGAVFPAIVLLKQDQARYLVATGMHRIRAAQEIKRDSFDAFIVTEPDQFRAELLIRLLNGIEGRGDTIKEQLWHAISLHEKFPKHSINELASAFNLTRQTVLNAWNEHQGIQRASRLGFDFERTQRQPQSTVIALNSIPSDLVYVKAAEYVVHFDLTGRDAEELVRALKVVRHKGEGAEIETVRKHHDTAEDRNRRAKSRIGKTSPTACTRFIGKCRAVNKQIRKGGIEQLHLSAIGDFDDALNVIEDVLDNLTKVKAEIERIQRLQGGPGIGPSLGTSTPLAAHPRH